MAKRLYLIPCLGIILTLFLTQIHGIAVTGDGMRYISMAHHIAEGRGVAIANNATGGKSKAVVNFQPLLSVFMAIPLKLGIDIQSISKFFNLLCLGINLLLAGILVYIGTKRIGAALLAQGLVVIDTGILNHFTYVLTEPFFFVFTQLLILSTWKYIALRKTAWLFISCALLSCITLMRYVGALYIFGFMLCLMVFSEKKGKDRFFLIAWTTTLSFLPLVLWFSQHFIFHNQIFDMSLNASTINQLYPLKVTLSAITKFLNYPFFMWESTVPTHIHLVLPALSLIALLLINLSVLSNLKNKGPDNTLVAILYIFTMTSLIGLNILWIFRGVQGFPDAIRFFAPLYNHIWCLMVLVIWRVSSQKFRRIALALTLVWVCASGARLYEYTNTGRAEGSYGRVDVFDKSLVESMRWLPKK